MRVNKDNRNILFRFFWHCPHGGEVTYDHDRFLSD